MGNKSKQKLQLGLPKGSLENATLHIFEKAGFNISAPSRCYSLDIDDPEIDAFLLRPQEIPGYIEEGKLDAGISGDDWILESGANVKEVCDLVYAKKSMGKVRWVLAVAKDSGIKAPEDLRGKRVSTEIVNLTEKYFQEKGIKAKVEFSWGASEGKPPRFADAIVDLTETGASLEANNLKILDTVLESSTKFIAQTEVWKNKGWKRNKIESLSVLLQGAIRGETGAVKLMMHVPEAQIEQILQLLPQSKKVAVKKIAAAPWYDVSIICPDKEGRSIIPQLRRMGCQHLIQFSVSEIVI